MPGSEALHGVAACVAAVTAVLAVLGMLSPHVTGYGGAKEAIIGLGVLALSLVLLAYRRLVQDRA